MKNLAKFIIFFLVFCILAGIIFFLMNKFLGFNQLDFIKDKFDELTVKKTAETDEEEKLSVEIDKTQRTILEGKLTLVVTANKDITVSQINRVNLIFVKEIEDKKYYVAEITNIGIGPSTIKITFNASTGETEDVSIPVTRESFNLPLGLTEIEPWENALYEVDGDNLLANVNKGHRLTMDYEPEELLDLNKEYLIYTNVAGIMLKKEPADYLKIMLDDLRKATGKNVVIASGYRSYNDQVRTYTGWLKSLGQEEADKISARPGFSEHQLGTVVDFVNEETNFDFTSAFDQTDAGKWLKENAYKYGFVQSYPEGKEQTTGYSYEAWHYRYIGVDNAKEMKEEGVTLIEFINN